MQTPTLFGRKMKKIKEYQHHILFEDEKTGIKECFLYYDLNFSKLDTGENIENNKPTENKVNVKNDSRLDEIIKEMNL